MISKQFFDPANQFWPRREMDKQWWKLLFERTKIVFGRCLLMSYQIKVFHFKKLFLYEIMFHSNIYLSLCVKCLIKIFSDSLKAKLWILIRSFAYSTKMIESIFLTFFKGRFVYHQLILFFSSNYVIIFIKWLEI